MILDLIPENNQILHQKVKKCSYNLDRKELSKTLIENMKHHEGLGLSANQIGIPIKAFAMITDGEPMVVFNPDIVEWSDDELYEKEGCLSFPYLFMPVKRAETIGTKFELKDGTDQLGTFRGLLSVIFQHEMEHMNGELFINSVSDFKLKSAMKKRKILKRKRERKQKNG